MHDGHCSRIFYSISQLVKITSFIYIFYPKEWVYFEGNSVERETKSNKKNPDWHVSPFVYSILEAYWNASSLSYLIMKENIDREMKFPQSNKLVEWKIRVQYIKQKSSFKSPNDLFHWKIRQKFSSIKTICYITYDMDFRFIPSDTVCFDKLSRCD